MASPHHQRLAGAALAAALAWPSIGGAEQPRRDGRDVQIEIPVLVLDAGDGGVAVTNDDDLDLANVVQTAAKGVTTVQEAPAIVTVLTGDDMVERGFDNFQDALNSVPGWQRTDAINNQFPFPLVRGTLQGMLYLHNGMTMFDPWANVPMVGRILPVELIKRVEVITGPGGVLWGSNSYIGVVNITTKDAEDVDGVEANVLLGHGDGDRNRLRAYVMAGIPELIDDVSVFLHASFESYQGPQFQQAQPTFTVPAPQANALFQYGEFASSDQPQSWILNLNGKLRLGAVDVYVSAPFSDSYLGLGFPGFVAQQDKPEDDLRDPVTGELICTEVPLKRPDGSRNPDAFSVSDPCTDRSRTGRDNRQNWLDRYVLAEYKTRFAEGQAGADIKVYAQQFQRHYDQLAINVGTSLLEGGLSFSFQVDAYRVGAAYDGDFELPGGLRLLYGAEAYREWTADNISSSRQGAGTQSNAIGPADLSRLPLACPREPDPANPGQTRFVEDCPLTFQFASDRTVLATYLNPQWKLGRKLTLDGGARVQAAPGAISERSYPLQLIFSGAAVLELARNWHTKLNYAQGFRSPWFLNTDSNGESIQVDGARDLEVERSQAIQGELNARVFKGSRRLREVNFRLDYSYTKLENLIQIIAGRYKNTGDRGIHSVEFLGKVYLKGDHRLELGYTWLQISTDDIGRFRATPEHWFNVGGVFSFIPNRLQLTTTLSVLGAFEDPNRMVEFRDVEPNDDGIVSSDSYKTVQPHEVVLDRIPPAAELMLGLTYLPGGNWRLRAAAYNVFNTRHYNPDGFSAFEPRFEILPNPYPDFRATLSATYAY